MAASTSAVAERGVSGSGRASHAANRANPTMSARASSVSMPNEVTRTWRAVAAGAPLFEPKLRFDVLGGCTREAGDVGADPTSERLIKLDWRGCSLSVWQSSHSSLTTSATMKRNRDVAAPACITRRHRRMIELCVCRRRLIGSRKRVRVPLGLHYPTPHFELVVGSWQTFPFLAGRTGYYEAAEARRVA